MSTARTRIRPRRLAATAAAATLAVVLTACGGGAEEKPSDGASKSETTATDKPSTESGTDTSADDDQVLATIKGGSGVEVSVNSAVRDASGFITVNGQVENSGDKRFADASWAGSETELLKNGTSLAGATLVDKEGKKRYLILRDTDGACLCTRFTSGVDPDEKVPFYAQFPAPPEDVTEVDFQIPTLPTATIKISEG